MTQGYLDAADDPRIVAERVQERLIVDIWERQAFDEATLRRLGLRVVFRGVPSDAGGPDYQDAILAWDEREVISGDVEFHARSSDWYRHGHDRDPRYNRVVLHVVWNDDVEGTRRADGRRVPTLEVGGGAVETVSGDGRGATALLPHPCIGIFAGLTEEALKASLHSAGMRRFRERAERFSSDMSGSSPDQTAYVALLEALGYASNREAFRQLAEVVPYAWLQSIPTRLWAATLLDAAGLGPPSEIAPPAHLPSGSWRLARLRPANHPERRLLGVALLLERLDGPLAERLAEAVEAAEKPSELRQALVARAAGEAFIGAGRVDEVVASAVLPFVSALEPESEKAVRLFEQYPSPPANRWTRVMVDLFAKAGHQVKPRTAVEHQGIHHLYHGHCRMERRMGCPVCDPAGSEEVSPSGEEGHGI